MIHLRILVPGDLSASVESLLLREPGAVHVSVVAGASREPAGDLIEADVVRAALGPIFSRLEDLHVPERGSISFVELGDTRSLAAETATAVEGRYGEELISWDEVAARTRDDTSFTWAYGLLMTLAGVIAAGGILTNNELLIVGAMIVSPDYGPVAGFCVAAIGGSEAGVSSLWAQPAASSNSRTAEPACMTNFAAIMVPDWWAHVWRVFIAHDRLLQCPVVRASFRRQAVLSSADRQQPDSDHPDDRIPQARRPMCPSSVDCSAW